VLWGARQLWLGRGERKAAEQASAALARKAANYQAWQVVNTAQGKGGNGGRIDALQDLAHNGVSLAGVRLEDAWLEGIRLEGASLPRASLRNAVLRGAKLRGADLQGADLTGANLTGVDLRDAVLTPLSPGSCGRSKTRRTPARTSRAACTRRSRGRRSGGGTTAVPPRHRRR